MGRVSPLIKGYQTIAVLFLNTLILLICFEVFASITSAILILRLDQAKIAKIRIIFA